MHSSIFISTLLGAGVLAFPQNKHAHLHEKKDAVFYSQWQEGPHTLVQEYVNENGAAGNAAPASTSAVVAVKADYAHPQGGYHSWAGPVGKQRVGVVAPTTTAAAVPESSSPVIIPAAVSSTPTAAAVVPASQVDDTPPASSSPSAAQPSGSDTTSGTCNPTSGDAWYSPPCTGSSGASALDKINSLRTTWNSSLTDYAWDAGLAQNAYDTAWKPSTWTEGTDSNGDPTWTPDGEGAGWVMGHHLFNGSNGQCIAEGDNAQSSGDLTPIEIMFLEWICEKPSPAIQSLCTATNNTSGDPNCNCDDVNKACNCGHAMIIQDTGMNNIGCYYMYKVATGKTDNAVNAAEQAQELGAGDNGAKGMLTCDFTGSG